RPRGEMEWSRPRHRRPRLHASSSAGLESVSFLPPWRWPARLPGTLPASPLPKEPDMSQRTAPTRPAPPETPNVDGARIITFAEVREHPRVKIYVRKADEALAEIGYTEHGERHVGLVAHIAYNILKRLGYPERESELAAI